MPLALESAPLTITPEWFLNKCKALNRFSFMHGVILSNRFNSSKSLDFERKLDCFFQNIENIEQ